MSSNLPPGVSPGSIPGNRWEDIAWERAWDWAETHVFDTDLTVEEFRRAILIGIAAVQAERGEVKQLQIAAIAEAAAFPEAARQTIEHAEEQDDGHQYDPGDSGTWHRIEGYTREDGTIWAAHWTNDNADRGVPADVERWELTYKDREHFEKNAGRSRTGFLGCKVRVTLDGKEDY